MKISFKNPANTVTHSFLMSHGFSRATDHDLKCLTDTEYERADDLPEFAITILKRLSSQTVFVDGDPCLL